jgi:hypothetical protein
MTIISFPIRWFWLSSARMKEPVVARLGMSGDAARFDAKANDCNP